MSARKTHGLRSRESVRVAIEKLHNLLTKVFQKRILRFDSRACYIRNRPCVGIHYGLNNFDEHVRVGGEGMR